MKLYCERVTHFRYGQLSIGSLYGESEGDFGNRQKGGKEKKKKKKKLVLDFEEKSRKEGQVRVSLVSRLI